MELHFRHARLKRGRYALPMDVIMTSVPCQQWPGRSQFLALTVPQYRTRCGHACIRVPEPTSRTTCTAGPLSRFISKTPSYPEVMAFQFLPSWAV